jgi:ribosome biogenesis protein YTM1
VAAAAWPSAAALATGSWDGSVRGWAPDRGGGAGPPVDALHTGAAVFAVAASAATGPSVVAFGGAATGVKLWDSRAPAAGAASGAATLGTHADWVAALAAHPLSPHTLASASHDGSVRLWDARGRGVPLASLAAHDGKALAVAWTAPGVVVSGGADGRVRSWAVKV